MPHFRHHLNVTKPNNCLVKQQMNSVVNSLELKIQMEKVNVLVLVFEFAFWAKFNCAPADKLIKVSLYRPPTLNGSQNDRKISKFHFSRCHFRWCSKVDIQLSKNFWPRAYTQNIFKQSIDVFFWWLCGHRLKFLIDLVLFTKKMVEIYRRRAKWLTSWIDRPLKN